MMVKNLSIFLVKRGDQWYAGKGAWTTQLASAKLYRWAEARDTTTRLLRQGPGELEIHAFTLGPPVILASCSTTKSQPYLIRERREGAWPSLPAEPAPEPS